MLENLRFVPAWRRDDARLEADAMAMWAEMNVLPSDVRPEMRARECVVLAYAGERLVGITTAQIRPYEPVRQKFAFGRILLRPEVEKQGLVIPLTIAMREELREWSRANPDAQVAGMAIVIAAGGYGKTPVTAAGLALAGYTPQGQQVRLYWWDHFRLPV